MSAPAASPDCLECRGRPGRKRGLCGHCYRRLARLVRSGETTWEKLEEAGRARPPARSHQRFPPSGQGDSASSGNGEE